MKIQKKKQAIGENLLYVMVWAAIILSRPQLPDDVRDARQSGNVLIAWIAPYLIIFLIHNAIIAPRYVLRRKYGKIPAEQPGADHQRLWLVQI